MDKWTREEDISILRTYFTIVLYPKNRNTPKYAYKVWKKNNPDKGKIHLENVDSNYTVIPNNSISSGTVKHEDRLNIYNRREISNENIN